QAGVVEQAAELLDVDVDHRQAAGDELRGPPQLGVQGLPEQEPGLLRVLVDRRLEPGDVDVEGTSGQAEEGAVSRPGVLLRLGAESALDGVDEDVGDGPEGEEGGGLAV